MDLTWGLHDLVKMTWVITFLSTYENQLIRDHLKLKGGLWLVGTSAFFTSVVEVWELACAVTAASVFLFLFLFLKW